ncbi:ParB N-terminal domain-containing protein [Prescottella equi]|uniref:ParB N-terminal domain-containing protein n=1 Tax=Rhodococcus hoagii TaxID=43767 RepID=UPI000D0E4204|nr:ParB N-terminal domain-containing protein [Prescottella equi]AVP71247.1 hypothetical protein C7H75_24505 [Prescottella equi]
MSTAVHDLSVVDAKVGTLKQYKDNPRVGDVVAIAESLQKVGQYKPIVVNKGSLTGRKNEVLAGNHTLQAAKQLGWPTVKAVHVDVDEDTAKRIVLADNKTADLGDYNSTILTNLLTDLDGDLDGTGFTFEEVDDMLADLREAAEDAIAAAAPASDPDEGEQSKPEPKYGDDDPGMANKKSMDEKLEGYAQSDTRSIILSYQGDAYVWMVDQLAELGEKYDTASNAETVMRLLEEATGEKAPGADVEAAA